MALTKLQIWNIALDHLKEEPLAATTETGAACLWLNRNYDQRRDYLLSRVNWRFAITRASLAKDATAPAFGWSCRYPLPVACLKPLTPRYSGELNSSPIPHEIENGYILTNYDEPTLPLRYVESKAEGYFTPGFVEVLCLGLALRMSHWMTGKASFTETLRKWYFDELQEARGMEAIQESGAQYYDDAVINTRYE